jgi:hypothetical protein
MTDISSLQIHQLLEERKQIAVIWSIEDVQEVRPDLNDDQAWAVLKHAENCHDANHGVCWETLKIVADCLFGDNVDDGDGGNHA